MPRREALGVALSHRRLYLTVKKRGVYLSAWEQEGGNLTSIVFQPRLKTSPARDHLFQTLHCLEILKRNSVRASDALRDRLDELLAMQRSQKRRHKKDLARLELAYRILRDVLTQQWRILAVDADAHSLRLSAPELAEKKALRKVMDIRRSEVIMRDFDWIREAAPVVRPHLIDGKKLCIDKIKPALELCEDKLQHTIFRFLRYTWSSPFSEYVGRRLRFLVRDAGNGGAIIGIAALGSSVMQIAERDRWIGWLPRNKEELHKHPRYWQKMRRMRAERIVSMMDLYVCGAIPPYSHLLGGKLICYIMASDRVRAIFKRKYQRQRTITRRRTRSHLVLLATTSLYGFHSSQYNRIRYGDKLLYERVGMTRGYGSIHLSANTFDLMRHFLRRYGKEPSHRFGHGVNWKMRVIRESLHELGLDSDLLMQHSYPRSIFAAHYAKNALQYLRGEVDRPRYVSRPFEALVAYWKQRWLDMRVSNKDVLRAVRSTRTSDVIWRAYP